MAIKGTKAGVSGGQKAAEFFRNSGRQAINKIEEILVKGGKSIERDAKRLAPVKSGEMRSSIASRLTEKTPSKVQVEVGTNVYYARFQHYGTGIYAKRNGRKTPWIYKRDGKQWISRGSKAHPFLFAASKKNLKNIRTQLRRELKRGLVTS